MGSCTAQYKMLLFRAQTSVRGWRNNELAHLKKERRRRRKTICMFCCCWVGYFRDAFSRHWESCWSWKHSKMNSMLSSSPFLRFGEILMYCHILRVRAIPTLESTDSMIQLLLIQCTVDHLCFRRHFCFRQGSLLQLAMGLTPPHNMRCKVLNLTTFSRLSIVSHTSFMYM